MAHSKGMRDLMGCKSFRRQYKSRVTIKKEVKEDQMENRPVEEACRVVSVMNSLELVRRL